jgi:hypothetical protein
MWCVGLHRKGAYRCTAPSRGTPASSSSSSLAARSATTTPDEPPGGGGIVPPAGNAPGPVSPADSASAAVRGCIAASDAEVLEAEASDGRPLSASTPTLCPALPALKLLPLQMLCSCWRLHFARVATPMQLSGIHACKSDNKPGGDVEVCGRELPLTR